MTWTGLLAGIAGVLALLALLFLLGRYTFWRPWRPAQWPRILMYHHVSPDAPASGMNITPERFESQLVWLKKRGYRFVTLSELVARPADERRVVLSFDDGYADNYTHAFPILKRHQAKATIFLCPDYAHDALLTPAQIREMQDSGLIEFGAHTLRHINLLSVPPAEAEQEIHASRAAVAALSGQPCTSFSYPYGRYGPPHVEAARQAGYQAAVTVKKAVVSPAHSPLELPRIGIHGAMNLLQLRIALGTGRYRL